MILTRTPFRISFAGGGSDFESAYRHQPGAVLSTAINKYMYISVLKRFDNIFRISYSRTEFSENVEKIEHPIVRECLKRLNLRPGLEIVSMADLPAETGMGSSSSFTVGLLHALHAFKGHVVSPEHLASEACSIEIDTLKEPIGKQDQYIAAYGGFKFIEFQPDGCVFVSPVICSVAARREFNRRLVVFYTGITRPARDVLSKQNANNCHKLASLQRLSEIARELKNVLTTGQDLNAFGHLLHEAWQVKKSLEGSITNEIIDECYERGLRAGALGGKLLGAGAGGFLLFFCEPHLRDRLCRELADLRELPFSLEAEGSKVIYVGSNHW
jgi:D-glycero-alpha-D-manno-heptose-7-phosphate kinase